MICGDDFYFLEDNSAYFIKHKKKFTLLQDFRKTLYFIFNLSRNIDKPSPKPYCLIFIRLIR